MDSDRVPSEEQNENGEKKQDWRWKHTGFGISYLIASLIGLWKSMVGNGLKTFENACRLLLY